MVNRLSEIKARCDVATPGPWEFSESAAEMWTSTGRSIIESTEGYGLAIKRADADFIAHAREDIPYLLAEIKRLERALVEATP